jgi:hypothetical protein
MHRLGTARWVWRDLPMLTAGLTLLATQSTPAVAQNASAGGAVSIEQPVGGSFAFDSAQGVLTAIFLTSGSNKAGSAGGLGTEFGLSANLSSDQVSVGVHDLGSSSLGPTSSPGGSVSLPAATALPVPPRRMLLVLAQFN